MTSDVVSKPKLTTIEIYAMFIRTSYSHRFQYNVENIQDGNELLIKDVIINGVIRMYSLMRLNQHNK
ncbi:MAG: hypothetical protein NVSMB40_01670 [Aquirhabdus sp.]